MYLETSFIPFLLLATITSLTHADVKEKDWKANDMRTHLTGNGDSSKRKKENSLEDVKRSQYGSEPADETFGNGNYEGDIILTPEQFKMIKKMEMGASGGSGIIKRKFYTPAKMWPGKTVYYELPAGDPGCRWYGTRPFCGASSGDCTRRGMTFLHYSSSGCWRGRRVCCRSYTWRNKILDGIKHVERSTCIKFKQRTTGNRLRFVDGSGCSSNLGMVGSAHQNVNLKRNGCMSLGTVVHEMLHAMGFHHEQTRQDRDNYITVHYANIIDNRKFNFHKTSIDTKGIKYDIHSVMQYGSRAFSKNGAMTITVKGNNGHNDFLGQREAMSYYDRLIVNKVYGCPAKGVGKQDTSCFWVGTAPFCGGNPSDCSKRGMTYSHSDKRGDGHNCWTGHKVCCKRAYKCKQWIGTAPFCRGSSWECERRGLYFMRFDKSGNGSTCWTGKKVCCA